MISSKVTIDDAEIKIEHEECSDPSEWRDKGLFIESNSADNNTLSKLTFNDFLTIYVFWDSYPVGVSQEILYAPETGVLFIGCGSVSARVSTEESKIIGTENVCLFWGLSRHKGYVLETGELECFLYSLSGEKVSSTDVDPPYEMETTADGIKFESIVVGTTWLRYSSNG
ncbi:hypothetical protein ACJJIU_09455 [Microbulbifer sp. CnH-101-E]|uniref:hypothetical protein n=1 Tax=unclassified Microbulbifer TaxID=2619833 RepID=UPI0040398822